MVDGAGTELDRERNRSPLGELVPMQAQSEPRGPARLEVASSLVDVEGPFFDKNVCGHREPGRLRQHLRKRKLEVRGGATELRRHRVCPEPGGDPAGLANRAQRGELGLLVESVAGLGLERGRAGPSHPPTMASDSLGQAAFAG